MSNYKNLKDYISQKMRMSHIYQPLMLMELMKGKGKASGKKIAQAFLSYDETQIDYYKEIVKLMPFKYLSKHLKEIKRDKDKYYYDGFDLSDAQRKEIMELCHAKLDEYIDKRGLKKIFQHRTLASGVISGSVRYKVLTRAKNRCELCGISSKEKALEVDHIEPRSLGGKDELSNFQALCYTCNAQKGNKDNTEFKKIIDSYEHRENDCLFCKIPKSRIIKSNKLAYVIEDQYPVTKHHCLIITYRHSETYFDLYQPELNAINQLIKELQKELMSKDKTIEGFNIGTNLGEVSGQTIFHTHIHLIPRRRGDSKNPKGGVRGVIESKKSY